MKSIFEQLGVTRWEYQEIHRRMCDPKGCVRLTENQWENRAYGRTPWYALELVWMESELEAIRKEKAEAEKLAEAQRMEANESEGKDYDPVLEQS